MPLGNGLETDAFGEPSVVGELQSFHDLTITPLSVSGFKNICRPLTLRNSGSLVMASLWLRMIEFDFFSAVIDE